MKMGKRNGKRKRKGNSCLLGRGVILAHPGASARAGAAGGPRRSGAARADAVGTGPHVSERRGGGVNGTERRRRGGGEPVGLTAGDARDGSPSWVQF
jgi:hypothetical protein